MSHDLLPAPPPAHPAIRAMLTLPGRGLRWVEGTDARLTTVEGVMDDVAQLARDAPRGNAFLALEHEVAHVRVDDQLFAIHADGRSAFVVGGLLGQSHLALRQLATTLSAAGFRRVLLFPVSAEERDAVRDAGWDAIEVGSEAFIDLDDFTLRGKPFADLRQMRNRATKRFGVTVEEVPVPDRVSPWHHVYDRWLATRPQGHAMHLLIGTPRVSAPHGRRYFQACDADGRPVAIATLIPGWSGSGWGVDVMARDPDAPAGAMDLLLSEIALKVRDEGAAHFTLGASPMWVRPDADAPWHLRTLFRWLYRSPLGNRLFHFHALHHFKHKFAPRWEPVYIAGWPRCRSVELYEGCRMWGIFDPPAPPRSG